MKLIAFEMKKQLNNISFLMIIILFTIFAFTQLGEVLHYPVEGEDDIQYLLKSGERDYLFVSATEEEMTQNTIRYLEQLIDNGDLPRDGEYSNVINLLKENSFEYVYNRMVGNENVIAWLNVCKAQFQKKVGSIDEINQNLRNNLDDRGYSPIFFEKYATYMQAIASLLIFPIFLLLFTRDTKYNMSEIIYAQPITSTKYIINRYFGALIPLMLFIYLIGLTLNIISTLKFIKGGWSIEYSIFLKSFIIYIMPTIFFLSSLIMTLMLLFKKAISVFPIYIIYVILNITPGVFENTGNLGTLFKVVVRLDRQVIKAQDIIINRVFYFILALILIGISCRIYKKTNTILKKGVTI